MSSDWALVFRGFAVAAMGACSTILYIVGISAAYIGRFTLSIVAMVIGAVLAFGFLRLIGSYLDAIDQREAAETLQMKPRVGAADTMETGSAEMK
jgi:chromosome condensin MukBEF MukE localization factor